MREDDARDGAVSPEKQSGKKRRDISLSRFRFISGAGTESRRRSGGGGGAPSSPKKSQSEQNLTWTELLSSPPSSPQPPTSTDSAEISPSPKTSEDDKDRKRRPSKFVAAQKSFADTVRQMTKLDFHRGSGAGGQGSPQSGVHWGDGGGSPISGADVNQRYYDLLGNMENTKTKHKKTTE